MRLGFLTYFISLESRYGEDLLLVVPAFVDGNVQPQSGKKGFGLNWREIMEAMILEIKSQISTG